MCRSVIVCVSTNRALNLTAEPHMLLATAQQRRRVIKSQQNVVNSHGEKQAAHNMFEKLREMHQGEENLYRSTKCVCSLSSDVSTCEGTFPFAVRERGVALCQQSMCFHFLSLSYCPFCLKIHYKTTLVWINVHQILNEKDCMCALQWIWHFLKRFFWEIYN